jgi:hypothetical protein
MAAEPSWRAALQEPYQASGLAEDCVLANYSQAFDDDGSSSAAWGWADAPCDERHVFMCRIMGEALHAVLQHVQQAVPLRACSS